MADKEPPAKRGKYKTWMLDPNASIPRTTKWRIDNLQSTTHCEERNRVWLSNVNKEDQLRSTCARVFEAPNESDIVLPISEPGTMANYIHIQVEQDMNSDYEETSDEEDNCTSLTSYSSDSEPDGADTFEAEVCHEKVGEMYEEDNILLYQNAEVSKMAAILTVNLFITEHKLSNQAMEDLIHLINILLPSGHKFVRSGYMLKKYFASLFQEPLPKRHKYCSICMDTITSSSNSCDNEKCQAANASVKEFLEINLKNQLSRLYQDPEFLKNLHFRFRQDYLNDENVLDIFSGSSYKEFLKPGGFLGADNPLNLSFSFYTDGINPFKSSNKQNLWPIFLMINELPPELRQSKKYLLLAGLWCSHKKPNMLTFGRPLIDTICDLRENGMTVTTPSGEETIYATLLLSTEDLQAKALVTNMKLFNGENGCSTCLDTGKIAGKNSLHRTWPYNPNMKYRTHKSVMKCASEATRLGKPVKGVKGASIFILLKDFNLVDGFVPDWMHGVCLGITKKMLALWINSENKSKDFFVGGKVAALDKRLTSIKVPDLLARKPRSLSDRAHWKATEFRAWLLHFSIPVLQGILDHAYLQHYSLLVSAMALLVSEKITPAEITEADNLIDLFCKEYADLYGDKAMTMNVHQLRHYVYFVRQFGPLWVYSCFGFETMNGCLTNMIHGTRHIAEQVAYTLSVVRNLPTIVKNLNPSNNSKAVMQFAKKLSGERDSTSLSFECQQGYHLLGKPKHQCLQRKYREALNTFLSCRGMHVISSTQAVDVYLRLKNKSQTITSTSYKRANKTCSYTVEFFDSSGQIQFGDVCCFVYLQATPVVIVNTYRMVPGFIINYKGFGLAKHISRVLRTNSFMALKLDQIKQICIKIEIVGNNDVFISRFTNMVERN